jgi:hypothetical protein
MTTLCHFAEGRILITMIQNDVMLNFVMLSIVVLIVVMLSVVTLNVVMLSTVGAISSYEVPNNYLSL